MKIAIFVHQPICAVDSINGILKALTPYHSFKLFSRDEVEPTFFNDVDCVCFPGGFGDADRFDTLMQWNADPVRQFLNRGGKYLGICMGAYWADKYYLDIVKDTRVVQYIKQPNSCTKRPHPKAMPVTWQGEQQRMYFYDGPSFTGNNFEVISRYSNNDPMAIIQENIGLIGCHLESEQWWYNKSYLKPHWHNNTHYKLLLEFVDTLSKH
jgi:glutamine amidotransferase-like uncharacterized protein